MTKKLKLLLQLLSDGGYHSGTVLGKKLKLTRGAIWEIIKQAKKYDIIVEAKTNLGYRIPDGLELLDKTRIAHYIKSRGDLTPSEILIFDELASTNSYLEELIRASGAKKYICLAEYQTSGRGRFGRAWVSPFARNICLSVAWPFFRELRELSGLGLVIAVATINALRSYGVQEGLSLKWPNDILWEGRKLAGILIEIFGEAHHAYVAIIGLGLNVNMFKEVGQKIEQPWCDIAQITKAIPQRNKLVGLLLDNILTAITTYQDCGLKPFLKVWQRFDVTYGKKVTLVASGRKITGIGCGINAAGCLLLKDRGGEMHTFAAGEVSLRF